jgi:uroporphyrinogen decarboxylase
MPLLGKTDVMTPLERVTAFMTGQPYDRIPCNPNLGDHAAQIAGFTVAEYHNSAAKMAASHIAAYATYGHDFIGLGPGHAGVAEALGSQLGFPENGTPFVEKFALAGTTDLTSFQIPDPLKAGRFPLFLDALDEVTMKVGHNVPIGFVIGGPLSAAYSLRGAEALMKDLYIRPHFVHELLDLCVKSTIPFLREVAKREAGIVIVDPVSSGSLISPALFRKFSLPYLKQLVSAIGEFTRPPVLHICGDTKKILGDMVDTGAGGLSLDNAIDLFEAKRQVGSQVLIIGNVNPAESMYRGTPEAVRLDVKNCLKKAHDSPKGFMLALGCELPIKTPPENVHALMAAARMYGKYPYSPDLFS